MGFLDNGSDLPAELDINDVKPELNAAYTQLIEDPNKSAALLAKVLEVHNVNRVGSLKKRVNLMFGIFSDITLENELNIYNSLISLCDKMEQLERNKALRGKSVIGIGGQFSAGKSRFINTISGIGTTLVTDQKPTTAIPTYIVRSDTEKYVINTMDGGRISADCTEIQALTHDFDIKYGFGFSDHIESIFIGTPDFSLYENIALLDTPGYSKNEQVSSRNELTDAKKAYEQLKSCDYLIWVAKMIPGITDDDISFIRSLEINRPILFVLNQADLHPQSDRESCLENTAEQIRLAGLPCAGVTVYSSADGREYTPQPVIQPFFKRVSDSRILKKDSTPIPEQFAFQFQMLQNSLDKYEADSKRTVDTLRRFVTDSEKIEAVRTVADMWSSINYEHERIFGQKKRFGSESSAIMKIVKEMYNK